MKKLLVLAAVSAMAMGAKAEYCTVSIPDAKAVYFICTSIDDWNNNEEFSKAFFLADSTLETYSDYNGGTWDGWYSFLESTIAEDCKMAKVNDGKFAMYYALDEPVVLMALTDATELSPGAAYSMYYGTTDFINGHGEIVFQEDALFETGFLRTDGSPTPAPEPTSGLLLLLGVAGLALKRKRA